ncbi:multidrug DMT transporter permease [Pandoraea terrae]|uniref:Multidrug DMT transporter permease n=1 Tax=Pandoraea terrae TaxID=1537710 RepID=A0A5E4YV84_9BURK|nr:DMT family transporter [Pandoraea terrae]VVE52235.1 multidrug DMT transporter permease [Pandoraea terrae]
MNFVTAKRPESTTVRHGVALMTAAALLTPIPDALAKILGENYGVPVAVIALARFIFQMFSVLPLLLAFGGWTVLRVQNLGLHLLRGVLLAAASIFFFAALKAMPLADAIAIFFIQPMTVTILAVVFLQEAPDLRRIAAVLAGFGGALMVIRPNFVMLGPVATLPLICAILFAIYLVLGRHLSKVDSTLAMHFYTGLGGTVSLGAILAIGSLANIMDFHLIKPVDSSVWTLLVVMSLFASLIHLMYIQAYRLAPAGLLAPFSYIEIVSAIGLGLLLFAEFPDPLKGLGMAIIIGSGLSLRWTDRSITQQNSAPIA